MQPSTLLDSLKDHITQVKSNIAQIESPNDGNMLSHFPWMRNDYSSNKIIISLLDIIENLDTRLKAAEDKLQVKEAEKPLGGSPASKQLREAIASLF
jgi:hypothetical protein